MKNKITIKFAIILSCIFLFNIPAAVLAQEVYSRPITSPQNITPYTDIIKWRYKTTNGKTYKRLYNYTTQQWIGDWIPC